jgi:ketosteroid isomerase-like protein
LIGEKAADTQEGIMTEHTSPSLRDLVIRTFATIEAKDLEAMMRLFADDAVLIDPHFPTPQMQGKAVITEAFREAMRGMGSFGYTIVNYCESESGQCAAVETTTHHVVRRGMKLNFPQVFIFEVADGHISRLQAYEPYGPHGIIGVFLSLARLLKRFART